MPAEQGGGSLPHYEVHMQGRSGIPWYWEGLDIGQAHKVYLTWVGLSRDGSTPDIAGQAVVMLRDGSVLHEYSGTVEVE